MVLMGFWCTKQSEAIVCRVKRREGKMGFFFKGCGGKGMGMVGKGEGIYEKETLVLVGATIPPKREKTS